MKIYVYEYDWENQTLIFLSEEKVSAILGGYEIHFASETDSIFWYMEYSLCDRIATTLKLSDNQINKLCNHIFCKGKNERFCSPIWGGNIQKHRQR